MKKTIIFILTIITLISVFSVSAFAEKSGDTGSDEFIPTIGATEDSAEEKEEGVGDVQLSFTTDNMAKTLEHMGLGMLGVVIVLGLIACVVLVLNKIFKS